jgi:hypothetical protein
MPIKERCQQFELTSEHGILRPKSETSLTELADVLGQFADMLDQLAHSAIEFRR